MRYFVTLRSQEELAVDIVHLPTGGIRIEVDGRPVQVDALETDGAWTVRVGDRMVELWLDGEPPEFHFVASGARLSARVESEQSRLTAGADALDSGGGQVCAPMPGRVVKVLVGQGDQVEASTPVVVVEAMKMENELVANVAGTITEICVEADQHVDGGEALIRIG